MSTDADYKQIEPIGFGRTPWGGNKSTNKKAKLYSRGFGEEKTDYTEDNDK